MEPRLWLRGKRDNDVQTTLQDEIKKRKKKRAKLADQPTSPQLSPMWGWYMS